ncbi:sodium/potassium-transporting ATPase subunit alpha,E; H+/K+-exchanging ATPase [Thermoflexales bacterium]|nr:sodium/potassium-transporting ATPase subunit alpha,E; H+/K+-exchanging ATPase [Thermoflexales bacterium]
MISEPLYALRPTEVFHALESSPKGITSEQAQQRLLAYGPNTLREPSPPPRWRMFLMQLIHPMALVLWIAGLIAVLSISHAVLGLVIWLVVLANAAFSFWQEHRTQRAMTALKHLLPAHARVIRNGQEEEIPASEVVVGDLLVLAEGDDISADARVVEEYGLRTNNANLTGEAMPARRTADASLRLGISEVERPNLVFAGTSVVSGTGRAVVYETGMTTQFGRIANLTQTLSEPPSPLQQQLAHLTKRTSLIAIGLGVTVAFVSVTQLGWSWFEALLLAVGLVVAFIPEGLRPLVTLTLAMSGQRLADRGVLIKQVSTIETLGAISVICTDKSGTLTQNQMTVREVWVTRQRLSVSGVGYEPKGTFSPLPLGQPYEVELKQLLMGGLLCNNARLNSPTPDRPHWTALGDQTEAALRVLALKGGVDEPVISFEYPRIHELPFDAKRKRMTTIHRHEGHVLAFVKGAPREVLQLCTQISLNGEVLELNNAVRAEILAANDDYARNALRVLAIAMRTLPTRSGRAAYTPESVERGLTFLGLVAMMDPPRIDVADAMKKFHEAGIRLTMITGDYGLTAESVARRIGLLTTPVPPILTGAELDALSDDDLQRILGEEIIFARMAPDHKLRIVAALQARGETVAVIGDGVNDAPALRKSDIGIAMGVTGTDVAKQAADLILTDDRFGAIVTAIEEGRAVFDNLRKFTTYIFASNVPEIAPFIMLSSFGVPLALTVAQILAIDLGTDILPALALGVEKPEPRVMQRKPRQRHAPLVTNRLVARAIALGLIETVLCFMAYFALYRTFGYTGKEPWSEFDPVYIVATTVFFLGVVAAQIGSALACRTEVDAVHHLGFFSNRYLWGGLFGMVLIALALVFVPFFAEPFHMAPPPPQYWLMFAIFPPIVFGIDWVRKLIRRRWERRNEV